MGKSPFTMPGSGFYGKGNQSVSPGKYTASPMKVDPKKRKKEVRVGSMQETETDVSGKTMYKTQDDVLLSGKQKNLLENKPEKGSAGYAGWKKAYDKASEEHTKS